MPIRKDERSNKQLVGNVSEKCAYNAICNWIV